MKTFLVVSGHVLFDVLFGWAVLNLRPHHRTAAETTFLSVLVGMYAETLSIATLMLFGMSLQAATLSAAVAMTITAGAIGFLRWKSFPRVSLTRPEWFEWVVMVAVGEKVAFAVWELTRTTTYFDDALMHWSGRARALFGGVNWSMDASSPFFLAKQIGNSSYPLQAVIWRAVSATLNGNWNEVISRADGLVFFIVIVGTVWVAVLRFSKVRWLAAAAAFVVAAVPLHAWHAAAGYNDIAVEAFVVASLAALMRGESLIGGLMAAGAAWSKHDGLALFLPALAVACVLLQLENGNLQRMWRAALLFVAGFATIAPWLVFNVAHSLGINPGEQGIHWHANAIGLLWDAFTTSPSSSILWIGIFPCLIYSGIPLFRDRTGRALLGAFLTALATITFVFSAGGAYAYLENETTIHRVLMQFSAMSILVATYGFWLRTRADLK